MNADAAASIAWAAINRVNPAAMIAGAMSRSGTSLTITTERQRESIDLSPYRRIVVLGAGKAAAAMVQGLEAVLGDDIDDGLIVTKYEHGLPLQRVRTIEAGHPVPDANSLKAGREIAAFASDLGADTLCFAVVSGGGSSLLTLPAEFGSISVSLEDVQETTRLLLAAGAPIADINCVRRHLSGIAGGRFVEIASPARMVALVLSDVVGDKLESIASGLVAPDPTSYDDALDACRRYDILGHLPGAVRALLEAGRRGQIPDTPTADDPVFERLTQVLIGTNAQALDAARRHAIDIGYDTIALTSQLTGETREIARIFTGMARDIVRGAGPVATPACVLAGGETTVTLRGDGLGGRNQEMALAFLDEIAANPQAYRGVTFLSVGTDGTDGPTDAAGGIAAPELVEEDGITAAITTGLENNDAYHVLERVGGLFKTGPTNTNVCDVQILLVDPTPTAT